MAMQVGAIVDALGGELYGDANRVVERIAPLERACGDELSFLADARLTRALEATHAGCVIVGPKAAALARSRGDCIVTPDPLLYFARLSQLWRQSHGGYPDAGIHATAVVEAGAVVHPDASVGAFCHIGRGARVGAGSVLGPRVTLAADCRIGARCLIQSGAVIGADGFGFAPDGGAWLRIEQLGAVVIGDDVEIGANTCVDRGTLDDTVIEDGVKLDNLIQIGHNCRIGKHTAMAGCVGVAGSAHIGAHCTVGGAGMILGHLTIADHVHISAASIVTRSILKPGHYTGFFPIDENATWEKNAATLRHVHALRERVRQLERRAATPP